MTDTLLKVDNLTKHFSLKSFFNLFGDDGEVVKAVDGISFRIERGETYGVVGESGSGKSTTARLITRLIDPTSGTIEFDGKNISDLPLNDFHKIRPRIQMVFQDPYTSLNPRMRVSQTLGNPLKLHKIVPDEEIENRVVELLELVGLQADHRFRYPHEFSGG